MKTLSYLTLEDMEISDISFLKNLKNLEGIDLRCNKISDISPLAEMYNDNNYDGAVQQVLLYENPVTKEKAFADLYPTVERHLLEGKKQDQLLPAWFDNFEFGEEKGEEKITKADVTFLSADSEIVEVTEDKALMPKQPGTTTITAKLGNTEKSFAVVVEGQVSRVPVEAEDKPTAATVCEKVSAVLSPKGELHSVNTGKTEAVAKNVKSYLAKHVAEHYTIDSEKNCWGEYFVLDSDDTLWRYFKTDYESKYQKEEILKNVESYNMAAVMTKDHKLYDIQTNKLIRSDVKQYEVDYEGALSPYILTTDGTFMNMETDQIYATGVSDVIYDFYGNGVYCAYIKDNTLNCCKDNGYTLDSVGTIADVESVEENLITKTDGSTWEWSYQNNVGLLCEKITSDKIVEKRGNVLLDEKNSLWYSDGEMESGMGASYRKVADNVKTICKNTEYFIGNENQLYSIHHPETALAGDVVDVDRYFYLKADGSLWSVKDTYLPNYADGVQIMTDVSDFSEYIYDKYEDSYGSCPCIVSVIRKDGSVWMWETNQSMDNVPVMVTEPIIKRGDIGGDGKVTTADVKMLFNVTTGRGTLTEDQKKLADVTGDGKINTADVKKIFMYTNKRIDSL